MSLLRLPSELHFIIIQSLGLRDIYALTLTSRHLAHLLLPTLHAAAYNNVDGLNALEWAALRGHESLVRFLLRPEAPHPVDVNACHNRPPMFFAIEGAAPATIVPILIAHGADIRLLDHATNVLHSAAKLGNATVMSMLLDVDAIDVNNSDANDLTPLHKCVAATRPNPEVAELLLRAGADLEAGAYFQDNFRALHYIARSAAETAVDVAAVLIAHGAEIEARSNTQQTPLHQAAHSGTEAMISLLLTHGASVDPIDESDCTPLHYAARHSTSPNGCELLIQAGADTGARNYQGDTPLDLAAIGATAEMSGQYEASVRVLLRHSRSPCTMSTNEQLILWAVKNGLEEVVRLILWQKLDVNMRDEEGRTLLHYAALFGMVGIVKLLLERGADATLMVDGKTALALAAGRGEDGVVEVLVSVGGDGMLGSGESDRRRPPPRHGARRGVVMTVGDGEGEGEGDM